MTDPELLARIARSAGEKAGYKQLVRELSLAGGRERRLLLEQLARLTARGALVKLDREHWSIPRPVGTRENLAAGRLDLHRDGYGFVRPNRRSAAAGARQTSGQEDIFIPPNEINGAMQGDEVLVEVDPPKADGRRLGRIVRVIERRNPTVVGVFHYARSDRAQGHSVVPFDERMTQPILIPAGQELPVAGEAATPHRVLGTEATAAAAHDDLEGLIVDVEINSWPTPTRPPVGRVIEVLGDPDDFGVDVEMMIRKHQLPRIFPENVLAEARRVAHLDEAEANSRRDFRSLPIVTIDGETARDFDDAVLVTERAGGGYELQVHIADVAEYVRAGTDIDLEARLRGTSVYFPDRAIPMLPQELSTDICSLRPDEDRLVLSCILQLDSTGRIESYEIVEGVIRSAARMTYTEVHAIIEGDAEAREEFMLAANECVATWLEDLGVPSLYRIHEKPEPRRVVEFEELAAAFGYSLGLGALPVKRIQTRGERRDAHGRGRNPRLHEIPEDIPVTPRMYQKLAAKIEGKPEERILSYLMLRSLKQARYSEINEGHFALAAPTYTHFTSPIRRYPDLIVHRIAKALLRAGVRGRGEVAPGRHSSPWTHPNEGLPREIGVPHPRRVSVLAARVGGISPGEPPIPEAELAQIAEETSLTERRAAEAERELVEWKKVRFMQDRVGEEFAALVLNPAKFGLFVELTDLFVEGLVPIDTLRDDRYTWRENTHEIIGERTGRRFRAGDRVQVILDRILAQERKLQFSIVEEGLILTGRKAANAPSKAKKTRHKEASPQPSKGKKRFGKKCKRR